jgi:AbiU2
MTADHDPTPITLVPAGRDASATRFKVAVDQCDVSKKEKLHRYRQKWLEWMSWYELSDTQPNSIESQIHTMIFNDFTYRAAASVRASVDPEIKISARSSTLAYLLDQGYLLSQVLSIQKLLDARKDVISVRRLLRDVDQNRELITREIYVAGDGYPYNYDSWTNTVDKTDPMVRHWGIEAPGLSHFAISKQRHEAFDRLSGKKANERSRDDVIRKSIFRQLNNWISGSSFEEIKSIRDNFIAHPGDALKRDPMSMTGIKFSQIDELQRAIVRVERALTDCILSKREARDVVPLPPLGIFSGLDFPYATHDSENSMHQRWRDLSAERNGWQKGILEDLASTSAG